MWKAFPQKSPVENDKVTFQENYSYFCQVQGQIDVPGKIRCDLFFFYTHSGIFIKE